jgi:hypothetical protein
MKVTIYTVDGVYVEIENMDDATVLDMVADLEDGDSNVMTFALDGESTTHILRRNIVRIDVDPGATDD